MTRIGLTIPIDEETIAKYARLAGKMKSAYTLCISELADKISQLEDLNHFCKQDAIEIASHICMNDKQFEEFQTLQREVRELLKPKLAEPVQAPAK